jgi:hypothetical protein
VRDGLSVRREEKVSSVKREDFELVTCLSEGNTLGKPVLNLVKTGGRILLVKDVRGKPFPFRWTLGLWLIRKEWNICLRLKGIKGVPDGIERIDRFAFARDFVEGRAIRRQERLSPMFFSELDRVLKEIHARGVVHLDLRHKGNILVSETGEPYLIDFNSGMMFREQGLLRRFLFPLLVLVDRSGFLKLKERVAPSLLTAEEVSSLRKLNRLRKLWIFN